MTILVRLSGVSSVKVCPALRLVALGAKLKKPHGHAFRTGDRRDAVVYASRNGERENVEKGRRIGQIGQQRIDIGDGAAGRFHTPVTAL